MLHLNSDSYTSFLSANLPDTTIIIQPEDRGGSASEASRTRRPTTHAHVNLDLKLSEKWRFLPTVYYQNSFQNTSVSLQAWAGTQLKEDMMLKFGLGYRTGDAGKILVGLDYGRLRAALSYDVPLSQLTPTVNLGSVNSFELGANYIFNIYKKPEVVPNILCPRI
ncbi:MAG: type IX secretion system membrane protein PorP/SprF [Lewinella sp.]|nr:type IX secretion system membrane protein PorP/SprF [Lewinella sp.]